MPLEVCGCACISLMAYSLICYYKFDWLTCADNFKLVLKSGLPTLLLTSVSCLQVAGPSSPPASAPGRALIGKRSFLPIGTLKGWTKKQYRCPLRWFFLQTVFKQEAFLLCDNFELGSQTQSAHLKIPSGCILQKRGVMFLWWSQLAFLGDKAKTGFWDTS